MICAAGKDHGSLGLQDELLAHLQMRVAEDLPIHLL